MTVCPPKGSHTALNLDLINAENDSLTEDDRNRLKSSIYTSIIEPTHEKYIKHMIAATNTENIDHVYKGLQSSPKRFFDSGFEIEISMWKNAYTIHTPWFGEQYQREYYKDDKQLHVALQIPYLMSERVGNGSLVIQLEVDIRNEEGWEEVVKYKERSGYQPIDLLKTWDEAEAYCQGEGGHLASILSDSAKKEISEMGLQSFWVGGRKQNSGAWTWVDGSLWEYESWVDGYGRRGGDNKCVEKVYLGWLDVACTEPNYFMCEASPKLVTGNTNITLKYTKDQLDFTIFQVWYSFFNMQASKEGLSSWKDNRMTGFRLSWFL